MLVFNSLARVYVRSTSLTLIRRQHLCSYTFQRPKNNAKRFLWTTVGAISIASLLSYGSTIQLDAANQFQSAPKTTVDPATSIEFPTQISVPSKNETRSMSLVGFGVRTVSFLSVKVYSVAFYADLESPFLKIPKGMSPEEKVRYIVKNCACVIRIVPVRTTSYFHLRDAFMRALQGRMSVEQKDNPLPEEEAYAVGTALRKLKSLFPNSSLQKHTPWDIYLPMPVPNKPRLLVFEDLGTIENDWVAIQLFLHYFGDVGPSPALKKSVAERLSQFEK